MPVRLAKALNSARVVFLSVSNLIMVSGMNEIFPRKFSYQNVDYVKLTNIKIQTGKRSGEVRLG